MSEEIIRLAGRGDGVTASGKHVAGTAPGDRVDEAGQLLDRGPHHADPACPHYGRCGGCQLQHIDDSAYARFLIDRIEHALATQRLGGTDYAAPHISPPRSRRRAALKAQKAGKRVTLGFNEAASHRLVDIEICPVMHPDLQAMLPPLRTLLAQLTIPAVASAVLTLCDQGIDLALGGIEADNLKSQERLTDFAKVHRLARLSIDRGFGPELAFQPDQPTICFEGVPVALPLESFLQATADGEAALVAAVKAAVGSAPTVADLFCGLGTFALPLSSSARVLAADAARDAVLSLQQGAAQAGRPLKAIHRDLFRAPFQANELKGCAAVIIDPPRAGAQAQVATLASSAVPRIAMVSCNPATFARDAKTLVDGGYRMGRITPVGQFRWSTHVELVAEFTR